MNDDFQIVIEEGVEIPKRELVGRPRESIYPIADMKQNQGFFLPVYGEEGQVRTKRDGTEEPLTIEEDWQRKVRQKQSYFSQLGKRHGVKIVTRVFEDGEAFGTSGKYKGMPGIGVWHGGPRTEKDDEEDAQMQAQNQDDGLPDIED